MQSLKLSFENGSGQRLAANLDLPLATAPKFYALFAHCFTCNRNLRSIVHISRTLAQAGIGVLRFDFTGLGESEGDFSATNFSSNVADVVAAARFLEQRLWRRRPVDRPFLGRYGDARRRGADSQLVRRWRSSPRLMSRRTSFTILPRRAMSLSKEVRPKSAWPENHIRIGRVWLDDLSGVHMEETIRDLKRALLILHAPGDAVVDVENASRIYAAARHPKSFISLDDADHLLTADGDAEYVGELIVAWVEKYLHDAAPASRGCVIQSAGGCGAHRP